MKNSTSNGDSYWKHSFSKKRKLHNRKRLTSIKKSQWKQ